MTGSASKPCVDSQRKRARHDLSPRLNESRAREISQPLSDIQVDVTCPGHQGMVQAEVDVSEDNVDDGICPGHEGMVQAEKSMSMQIMLPRKVTRKGNDHEVPLKRMKLQK